MEHIRGMLAIVDGFRTRGFDGFQRQVMALENEIRSALKYLDSDDLLSLATERGLYEDETCLDKPGIQNLFAENPDEGQIYCGNIEDRILDRVILGIDLFNLKIGPLHAIADDVPENIDLEKPDGWSREWSDEHDVFIPFVRAAFRSMALFGNAIDFRNEETFPRRTAEVPQTDDVHGEKSTGIGFF